MKKVKCLVITHKGKDLGQRKIVDTNGILIAIATKSTIEDYIEECLHGANECAILLEKFERIKDGKDAILWCDWETQETFISY